MGFPGGAVTNASAGDMGSIPGSGRNPREGDGVQGTAQPGSEFIGDTWVSGASKGEWS